MSNIWKGVLCCFSLVFTPILASADGGLMPSLMASDSGYQVAGLKFLPAMEDGQNTWTNRTTNKDHNIKDNCIGYNYGSGSHADGTAVTACANNQDGLTPCPFNRSLFKDCFCNTKKYPYSADNCYRMLNSVKSAFYDGTQCEDQRLNNKIFAPSCQCTTAAFPYTTDASCNDSKKVVDPADYCVNDGKTKRYSKCKCSPDYTYSSNITSDGYKCDSCTDDDGTHYKCTPADCPTGYSTETEDCDTGYTWTAGSEKSGGKICGICKKNSNCSYGWNSNGPKTIPAGYCAFDGYGHYAEVTVPKGEHYTRAWLRMWGDSSISGEFIADELIPGLVISNGGAYLSPRTITYNDRVTVKDVIRLEPGVTTIVFKKGVCGSYKCQEWQALDGRNNWKMIKDDIAPGTGTCPKPASDCPTDGCVRYFINSDGNITIPNGQCGWDAYGHTANITVGTPKSSDGFDISWVRMWADSTINSAFTTKELISGVVVSNGGYYSQPRTYTYKGKVTVNGVLKTDPNVTTSNFAGGIYGNYTCQSCTGTGGNSMSCTDINHGDKGCPCSMSVYKYDASTCNGILSGLSCTDKNSSSTSTKYSSCNTVANCTTYNVARTACTACASGYVLNGGACIKEIANCSTYNTDGTCKTCDIGYGLNSSKTACTKYSSIATCDITSNKRLTCNGQIYCCPNSTGYTSCSDMQSGTEKCFTFDEEQEEACSGDMITCSGSTYCCSNPIDPGVDACYPDTLVVYNCNLM